MRMFGSLRGWVGGLRTKTHARLVMLVVVGAVLTAGCVSYRWRPVPLTNISLEQEKIATRIVRLFTPEGPVMVALTGITPPHIEGRAFGGTGTVQVNLASATQVARVDYGVWRRTKQVIPAAEWQSNPAALSGGVIEVTTPHGPVVLMNVGALRDGWLTGQLSSGTGTVRVDLRDATAVEVRQLDGPMTVLKTTLAVAGIAATAFIIVLLTKESCPFVYVDRGEGWELVGEAYAGAAFRSTQRDDLLPLLPPGSDRTMRVRLRNEARETQYTDRAELLVVDHAPEVRALSTFDGHPLLVSASRAPGSAVDHSGQSVLRAVTAADGDLWETDPDELAVMQDERLEDRLTATFDAPTGGAPVLEITLGNTPWLDLIFGRFFAAMGDQLAKFLAEGNDPAAASRIRAWREREGVDLIVEMQTAAGWRRIAVVPTVGPAALREVAVPLPVDAPTKGPIALRVRGGLGFWRIDRMAMSVRDSGVPSIQRVRPTVARGTGGSDERETLGATDGRYNALSEMNESVDMDFELPALAGGQARALFLSSSGYYNVHPPIQSRWSPGVLLTIRDEPGGLSRFGRDLARQYQKAFVGAARGDGQGRDPR